MAADALGRVVGPHHHDGGVPADVGPDAPLDVLVAGEPRLLVGRDGVDVRRRDGGREADLVLPGPLEQLHQQEPGPGLAAGVEDGVEGVDPLRRLLGIDVGQLVRETVEYHPSIVALIRRQSVQDFGRLAVTHADDRTTERGWQPAGRAAIPHAAVTRRRGGAGQGGRRQPSGWWRPALRSDLHLTEAQLGLLASLASVTGALCALPAGGLVDRRHRPLIIGVAVVCGAWPSASPASPPGWLLLGRRPVWSAAGWRPSPGPWRCRWPATSTTRTSGAGPWPLSTPARPRPAVCFLLGALAVHFLSWRWLFWGLAAAGVVLASAARRLEDPVRCAHPGRASDRPPGAGAHPHQPDRAGGRLGRQLLLRRGGVVRGAVHHRALRALDRVGRRPGPVLAVGVIAGIVAGGRLGDRLTRSAGGSTRWSWRRAASWWPPSSSRPPC